MRKGVLVDLEKRGSAAVRKVVAQRKGDHSVKKIVGIKGGIESSLAIGNN